MIGVSKSAPTKKILFVISTMSAGGAERVASVMLNHWVSSGKETELLTFAPADGDHYPLPETLTRHVLNISWDSTNPISSAYSNFQRQRMIRREIARISPDVVVSFLDRTNIRVLSALLGSGIPVIVSERTNPRMAPVGRAWSILRRLLYPFATHIVVQTNYAADWARTHARRENISVIQNPLSFLPEPAPWEARKKQIVSMGRLVPDKGFDLLIRAFAASRAPTDGWELVIVGDGPERSSIEALLEELDIVHVTRLTGLIKEPAAILNASRIFVLASRLEGFPNALLEAMAMGCACLATDCDSGPADMIEDGRNGLLVPVDRVDLMAQGINRLISQQDEAKTLALHAREVRATHSAAQIMSQWDNLLDLVTAR